MYAETPFGFAAGDKGGATAILATASELHDWAHRPGAVWPCSVLARVPDSIRVVFDARGDLIDMDGNDDLDIPGDELTAWSSDVLRLAGAPDHPAIRHDPNTRS